MSDPYSEIISLLQPQVALSKLVHTSGPFRVQRDDVNEAIYCSVLAGRACLEAEGHSPLMLEAGDFVLIPAVKSFTFSSVDPPPPAGLLSHPVEGKDGIVWLGTPADTAEAQQLIGHCTFASPDAELLVSLLPDLVLVRGEGRLPVVTNLLRDEVRSNRPARNVIVQHLLQVLLIEAFRSAAAPDGAGGLLHGLSDLRIGPSLRAIHAAPHRTWKIAELAKEAGLSRSAFFTRFSQIVGMAPMGYVLNWRITLAKHMLRMGDCSIAEIAESTGYGSSSAFSTAFARHVGAPPAQYARMTAIE
ncbi:AraC family transcriptional regulator [Loktanella sp. D2R18]|uniref:AraC family transcriptional regulator n=1 Tax=Rhodobacterales TaxID=204455 RepID=UPI000DEB61B5|nr:MULTISPECIES: AraC family transcriptional regulator [Rhodobacterales]MDO6591759.1 AraC family transcriptional regulator [Yoonia sp. 1_MG-2023]RBW42408.1 AraC family transcriptional regulator [Loktanella sp. D2R18]